MFPDHVETDSLDLRQLATSEVDVFELYELFAARTDGVEGVFEYVPQEPYDTVNDASERIEKAESRWADGEQAQYGVYADGELAGYAGLFPEWERRSARIGFILGREFWGNGYAGEIATALTEVAFDRLDLELVTIGYEEGNDRSERAVEKFVDRVGGQYDGKLRNWTPLGDRVADHHRYSVSREEFEGARGLILPDVIPLTTRIALSI